MTIQTKKTSVGGAYARKEDYEYEGVDYKADIQNGDKITILSEGETVVGQFGDQQVYKIDTRNGEKNLTLNQKSINILIDEFGDEDKQWIGKELNVILKKDTIANKKVIICYLATDGWKIDEYGDLTKSFDPKQEQVKEDLSAEDAKEIPF